MRFDFHFGEAFIFDIAVITFSEIRWSIAAESPASGWITEWGFTDPKAFPNKKGQTLGQCMEEFLNTFDSLHQKVIMGPVLFYAYKNWLADSAGKLLPLAAELSNYAVPGKGNK